LLEALRAIKGHALSAYRSKETLQYVLDLCLQVRGKDVLSEILCENNHDMFRNAAYYEGIDKFKLIIDFYGKADLSILDALISINRRKLYYRPSSYLVDIKEYLMGLFEEHKLAPLTFENDEMADGSDNESLGDDDSEDEPIFVSR